MNAARARTGRSGRSFNTAAGAGAYREVSVRAAVDGMRAQLAALLEHEHAAARPGPAGQRDRGQHAAVSPALFKLPARGGPRGRGLGSRRSRASGTFSSRNGPTIPLTLAVNDPGDSEMSLTVQAVASIDVIAVGRLMATGRVGDGRALDGGPDVPLRGLNVLGAAERDRVVVEWNDTAAGVAAESVLEMFGCQVRRVPDAVAVAAGGVEMTYAELDAAADRLARRLP